MRGALKRFLFLKLPALSFLLLFLVFVGHARADDPAVIWVSDPVEPGETVLVTGNGFDADTLVSIARMPDDPKETPGWEEVLPARILERTGQSLKFILPPSLRSGVFAATIKTKTGQTRIFINGPTVQWVQADNGSKASPGGWIRVLGRNILRSENAQLALENIADKSVLKLKPQAGGLWEAAFRLPPSIGDGKFVMRYWNGNGANENVVDLGNIEIVGRTNPRQVVTELLPENLVPGREKGRDAERINKALEALSRQGGGTLRLAAGQYNIKRTIVIPPNVTLEGAGRDQTVIELPQTKEPPDAIISGRTDFSVRDLTIYAANHNNVIVGGLDKRRMSLGGGNITIENILVRAIMFPGRHNLEQTDKQMKIAWERAAEGQSSIRLAGDNIKVLNCDILGGGLPLKLDFSSNVLVRGNKFYVGRFGWYSIGNSANVIFENNDVIGADLQGTGGGFATHTSREGIPVSSNILFKKNNFQRLLGWDREAITSDGGGSCFAGSLVFKKGESFVETRPAQVPGIKQCAGQGLMVTDGKGAGQYATITAVTDAGIILDRPFIVGSDADTKGILGPITENVLVIGNRFEDTGPAVQFYGKMRNGVIAKNSAIRTDGYMLSGRNYRGHQAQFYVQILGNKLSGKSPPRRRRHPGFIQARVIPGEDFKSPLMRGVIIRGNELSSGAFIAVRGEPADKPTVIDVIVEKNKINGADIALIAGDKVANIVIRKNQSVNVRKHFQKNKWKKPAAKKN